MYKILPLVIFILLSGQSIRADFPCPGTIPPYGACPPGTVKILNGASCICHIPTSTTPVPTPTFTPTKTITVTPSPTLIPTPLATPTITPIPTVTPTTTITPTPIIVNNLTVTYSVSFPVTFTVRNAMIGQAIKVTFVASGYTTLTKVWTIDKVTPVWTFNVTVLGYPVYTVMTTQLLAPNGTVLQTVTTTLQ